MPIHRVRIGCPALRARYRFGPTTLSAGDKLQPSEEARTMNHLLDASAKGVYPIAATPFAAAGAIDCSSVESLVAFYLQCGVQGWTVVGLMGEAQEHTDEESAELPPHVLRCQHR